MELAFSPTRLYFRFRNSRRSEFSKAAKRSRNIGERLKKLSSLNERSVHNKVKTPGLGLRGQIFIRSQSLNIRHHPSHIRYHSDVSHLPRIKLF